ncbi:ATP F0F1 synthase subunit B' [Roseovarius sp. A46]|uniref:F0F1 ATP synthase subunit B' n=1 Tax=Roseovarius sp. A46 TaxID=2109331 RepID=UPI001010ACEF|nr:F0F1 ATP synthase subunit B' [Roseovarius sp. A46]RXV70275.1 ATP F0F1 synthase subunit B' [Roseovarius sp. A46]
MATETHDALSATASACLSSGGSPSDMPQLCGAWFGNQIFWLAIALIVLYFILSRIALPRIAAVLAERQGTITNDLAAAEDLKAKATEAEEAYKQALADAKAEAQKIIAETKASIKKDLDRANEEADAEIKAKTAEGEKKIAEIREGALDAVKEVAKDVTTELVASMGQKADGRSVSAAVNARMKG